MSGPTSKDPARAYEALVRWDRLGEVGEALAVTSTEPLTTARWWLTPLLDQLTAPHRLLEEFAAEAESVITGDPLAAARLRDRLEALALTAPSARGSFDRAQRATTLRAAQIDETDDLDRDDSTISFDGLIRLAVAVAIAHRDRSEALDAALDIIVGLAIQTLAADRLATGLATHGQRGVPLALNQLRMSGYPILNPPPMRFMMGGLGGPGGGGGLPGGGPPGGGLDLGEVPDFGDIPDLGLESAPDYVQDLLNELNNPYFWDPETLDRRPTWEDLFGIPPLQDFDRLELKRVKCLLALKDALTRRQEPPPPRPARVVWSDSITGITVNGLCPGDRFVIHGTGFGPPNADIGVSLATAEGCRAFMVPAADWTDTAITVTLPQSVISGPVGLVNIAYVMAYDDWANRMNALAIEIINNSRCVHAEVPNRLFIPPFGECPPITPVNHLRAGLPVIRAFSVNGGNAAWVEPSQSVQLEWDLRNVDHFQLTRLSTVGPQFAGAASVANPSGSVYVLGPFTGNKPSEATYELKATGPCTTVEAKATVKVLLRKVPELRISGIEMTQAIQTFPVASSPLVAHKDTIVRVHVAVETLGDFGIDGAPGEVPVSGEVRLNGPTLPTILQPLNPRINARPSAAIMRTSTDHTLNFRIPAAIASNANYVSLSVKVWTADEIEAPPTGAKTRPTGSASTFITWVAKRPFKVRYVRVSESGLAALSDEGARDQIFRAFELLATPPTDIAPARVATWHTSVDTATEDGIDDLLDHIDDQHDCTLSERIFPWEDECPDDDGAVWVAILPRLPIKGSAQTLRLFDISRNTVVVGPEQLVIAHELGHTLRLNHVDPGIACGPKPDGDYDPLPNGGAIAPGDAFDPRLGKVVEVLPGVLGTFDFMTYCNTRWVSLANWLRVFNKF